MVDRTFAKSAQVMNDILDRRMLIALLHEQAVGNIQY